MAKFYLQVREDSVITDAIEYPHGDYIEVEADVLPPGVHGGWFKLEEGKIVEYPELKPKDRDGEITELKEQIADLWEMVLFGGEPQ